MNSQGKHILLVEDNSADARLMVELLADTGAGAGELQLPVIVLTGLEDDALALAAAQAGAQDYLVKDGQIVQGSRTPSVMPLSASGWKSVCFI